MADNQTGLSGPVAVPSSVDDAVERMPIASAAHEPVTWLLADAIDAAHLNEWRALAARAVEANVFAEPWMVLAGLQHCNEARGAYVAFVRDAASVLIGVLPMAVARGFGRVPVRVASVWSHPNSFLHGVLVGDGCSLRFWLTLLPVLGDGPVAAPVLTLSGLPADGAIYAGLAEACRQLALPLSREGAVTRAMLATQMEPDAYWDESVRAKKRKELRRQWARLNEQGVLTTDHLGVAAGAVSDAPRWINEFLTLEASGWKGANGSALSSNSDTDCFFRSAMAAAHAAGQLEMTALRIDGRAIAMLITLLSGNAGFSFKTAFDEDYARFSPGVLLQRESLAILSARKLDWIDSCAAQDHPMIDSLWRERRTVLSLAMPQPGTINRLTYEAAQAAKRGWHAIKRMRGFASANDTPRSEPRLHTNTDANTGSAPAGPTQDDD